MKKFLTLSLLTAILFASSCKKETDTEMLANKLKNVINTEQVQRVLYSDVSVGDPSLWTIYGDWGTHYRFDPPLVYIENKSFNLAAMKSYEVVTISSYKCMVLVF
ncbi:MAG: hypothetical protein ACXVBZ_09365 [Flavisolibacter sp.]